MFEKSFKLKKFSARIESCQDIYCNYCFRNFFFILLVFWTIFLGIGLGIYIFGFCISGYNTYLAVTGSVFFIRISNYFWDSGVTYVQLFVIWVLSYNFQSMVKIRYFPQWILKDARVYCGIINKKWLEAVFLCFYDILIIIPNLSSMWIAYHR